jgi:hypothetical protein
MREEEMTIVRIGLGILFALLAVLSFLIGFGSFLAVLSRSHGHQYPYAVWFWLPVGVGFVFLAKKFFSPKRELNA